ncbi:hypothetical protein HanXRQr2_Chr17g0819641 [Helianthus annuus]|uniref:Uncharacterized protein n=1 Tax=Helianthus annuus TaxID=4232 RepID=A0A251V7D3_HELAN|nr:hypothetical protein HanXRQr2_Chr17g0819641 [Helianthus annuus]
MLDPVDLFPLPPPHKLTSHHQLQQLAEETYQEKFVKLPIHHQPHPHSLSTDTT